jgi:tyrosyl-tRNA synthetase
MTEQEQKIDELLSRGVAEVIDREHLKARLAKGDVLRVKLGIDPTSPNIHLGRSIPLLKLRDFQELGHQIVFIVGDFTGVIGDTSDKESERPMLSADTVKENMKNYVDQAGKLIDLSKVEVHHNSEWLSKLTFQEVCELADVFSLAEFSARENIRKRLDEGKRVSLREMLYPLMQGFDSVAVKADIELGGTDQRFNLLAGRELQKSSGQLAQDIMMTNLILGTDGRKMSSSWGNTINLLDIPNEMFGKIMSVPDNLITSYFVHCTRVPIAEITKMDEDVWIGGNPRDTKLRLAKEIVTMYHGADEAAKAEQYFIDTFSKKQIPENISEVSASDGEKLLDVIVRAGFAESKGDARRKIEQGGVEIDSERITDFNATLVSDHDGKVLKVGKKDFVKIVLN